MKIGNSIDPLRNDRTAPAAERTRAAGGGAAPAGAPAEAGASVALSSISRGLAGVDAEIDAGKVESVRGAIEQGRFRVDAERVADRMLQQSLELLGARHRS